MIKMFKFPKIKAFRQIIKGVKDNAEFIGIHPETENPMYDRGRKKPTLTFTGTVKLHGTNACVAFHRDDTWIQGRNRIITVGADNMGCANFVENTKDVWLELRDDIYKTLPEDHDYENNAICVYFEFAGKGIQNKVAISKLDKMAVIFAIKIVNIEDPEDHYYLNDEWVGQFAKQDARIFNIRDYETFSVDINFNDPSLVKEELERLTLTVENECPVGKAFGIENGIGEGIVFIHDHQDMGMIRFKCKGAEHQGGGKNKVKVSVSPAVSKSIQDFVEYAVPRRLEQAITEVFGDQEIDIKKMGDFLKWIAKDIIDEEMDVLKSSDLEWKQVGKACSTRARNWFMVKWNDV